MGILSVMNRNLISKFKSKLKPLSSSSYSSDPCHIFRRFLSAAAPSRSYGKTHAQTLAGDLNPNSLSYGKTHVPTLVGDLKPKTKPMFLIEQHLHEGCRNYYLLSANGSSWKDNLHPISNPFSGYTNTTSEQLLVGSCNELTLFFDNDQNFEGDSRQRRVSLWDPTTKRIHTLPLSILTRPHPVSYIDIECSGFGFEPKSQDYKVICFLLYYYENFFDSQGENHIELYSLKTNSWKPITATPLGTIPLQDPAVHINGVYYWLAIGGGVVGEFGILSFDFADEKFSLIHLPKAAELKPIHLVGYRIVEFHGSLATLLHSDPIEEADQPFTFEVLAWNGETWTSQVPTVTIGDDVLAGDRISSVLGLFLNDYLFLQSCKGELMIFDVKTSKLENLGIHADLDPSMLSVFPFVPI